jgi:hypothetical protein
MRPPCAGRIVARRIPHEAVGRGVAAGVLSRRRVGYRDPPSGTVCLQNAGCRPRAPSPTTNHVWQLKLQLADLSTPERLARLNLETPRPGRSTWAPFQAAGEQLFREGFAGLLAPSASRPQSLITCIFDLGAWPPDGCRPIGAIEINEAPPPPTGMTT